MKGVSDATLNASITAFDPWIKELCLRPGTLGLILVTSLNDAGRITKLELYFGLTKLSVKMILTDAIDFSDGSLFKILIR
jgi:hypothetical protein